MKNHPVVQTIQQYRSAIRSNQLIVPITAMAIVIGLYFSRTVFADALTSLTCIGPCVAVLATWMTLPAAPKRVQVWFFIASLLWCFALWYAFPTPSEYTKISAARYHATYVCIVGGAIATGVVVRIVSSYRYCHRDQSDQWPLSAKWGLMDLMTLSMGIALSVSAFTAAKITNLFTQHGMVCGIGFLAGAVLTLLVTATWRCLTLPRWQKMAAFAVLVPVYFWVFSFCENISLRSNLDSDWYSESKWGDIIQPLFTISSWTGNRGADNSWMGHQSVRLVVFAAVIVLPLLAAKRTALGLYALPKSVWIPSSRPLRVLMITARWCPVMVMIGGMVFLAGASWSMVFEEILLVRSGWPFIYHEVSTPTSMFNTGPATPGALVFRDSTVWFVINLVVAFLPSAILLAVLVIRHGKQFRRVASSSTFTKLLFLQLIFFYVTPAIFFQHLANQPRLYHNPHAISWLTRSVGATSWSRDTVVIGSAQQFDQLKRIKGGLRAPRVHLKRLHLTQQHRDLLINNHCLRYLTIEDCTWEQDLAFLLSCKRLHHLALEEVTLLPSDVAGIANCASLCHLELIRTDGSQWSRWPKNMISLRINFTDGIHAPIQMTDLSALRSVTLQNQVEGIYGATGGQPVFQQSEPVQIQFTRCSESGLSLLVEPSVPIHLKLESTALRSLSTVHLRQLPWMQDRPERLPRLVDLRSFRCDEVRSIRQFEATIANCETFQCNRSQPGSGLSIASIVLDGVLFPTTMEPHRMERLLTVPGDTNALGQKESDQILDALCGSLNLSDLTLRGVNASPQLLRRLIANNNFDEFNIDSPISAEEISSLAKKMPNLKILALINTQLDQSALDQVLLACPNLSYLCFDASKLKKIDLSKGTALRSLAFSHESFPELGSPSIAKLQSISFGNESNHPIFDEPQLSFYEVPPRLSLIDTWTQMHPGAYLNLSDEKSEIETLRGIRFSDVKVLSIHGYELNQDIIGSWTIEGRKPSQMAVTGLTSEIQNDQQLLNLIRERVTSSVWFWTGQP